MKQLYLKKGQQVTCFFLCPTFGKKKQQILEIQRGHLILLGFSLKRVMQHFVHGKGRLSYKAQNPHQRELFSPTEDTVPELTGLSSLTCLHNHEVVEKYIT